MAIQIDYSNMSRSDLYGFGRKMEKAMERCLKPGPDFIDLKRTTVKNFSDEFAAATVGEDGFQGCRVIKSDWIKKRSAAAAAADRFIGKVKGLLEDEPEFGLRWNVAWVQLGFKTPGTIETPSDLNAKMEVLRSTAAWLSKNPAKEVTDEKFVITHQRAGDLEEGLANAISKIDEYETKAGQCQTARDTAEEVFKKRIRAVIDELDFLLDPMDPRWTSFGLNKPGETQRPDQPQNVQATVVAPNRLRLSWETAARRSRYKVRVQVAGRDEKPATVTEVFEESAELTFEAGQTVRVEIVAVNGAGDSAPSAVVEKHIASAAA